MERALMPRFASRRAIFGLAALASILSAGAIALAAANPAQSSRPQRIVSLNLCTDQLLLELADRSQIAGVTHNAIKPDMSAAAAKAKGLHIVGSSGEDILAIDPDLILGISARRNVALAALAGHSYNVLDVESAERYEDIVAQIRLVAAAIGHVQRGEALIARMDRDLRALPRPAKAGVAAYYQRRGYMTGTGTLVDDLMHRVGLVNLAGKLGKPPLSQLSLEEMMAAQPDYLIVESATNRVTDQGTEMLHHPILDAIPRLSVPEAWTVCGSPAYVLAAQSLSRQINAR